MDFEWDENKARINRQKHGVDFHEARTVFLDPLTRIFDDIWHLLDERRERIVGNSSQGRLLLVCFTSSREATAKERKEYEEHRQA